jgi:hypothetical protein
LIAVPSHKDPVKSDIWLVTMRVRGEGAIESDVSNIRTGRSSYARREAVKNPAADPPIIAISFFIIGSVVYKSYFVILNRRSALLIVLIQALQAVAQTVIPFSGH